MATEKKDRLWNGKSLPVDDKRPFLRLPVCYKSFKILK